MFVGWENFVQRKGWRGMWTSMNQAITGPEMFEYQEEVEKVRREIDSW